MVTETTNLDKIKYPACVHHNKISLHLSPNIFKLLILDSPNLLMMLIDNTCFGESTAFTEYIEPAHTSSFKRFLDKLQVGI